MNLYSEVYIYNYKPLNTTNNLTLILDKESERMLVKDSNKILIMLIITIIPIIIIHHFFFDYYLILIKKSIYFLLTHIFPFLDFL